MQGREKGKGKREKEMPGNGKPFEIIAQRSKSFRKKRIRNQAIPFPFSLFPIPFPLINPIYREELNR